MDAFLFTKTLWKIAPGNARTVAVEDGVDEKSVVFCRYSDGILAAREEVLNSLPLMVSNGVLFGAHSWLLTIIEDLKPIKWRLNYDGQFN